MNFIISVAIIAIILAGLVGYILGFRHGKADEREEAELRHGPIASRQVHGSIYGKLHGRN